MNTGKIKIVIIILLVLVTASGLYGYSVYKDIFKENVKHRAVIYIPEGCNLSELKDTLASNDVLENLNSFLQTASLKKFKKVHSGRYILKPGMTNNEIVNIFRSGKQTPVKLTFNNIRTINDFAGKISSKLELDSATLISLLTDENYIKQFGFDKQNIIGMFIPDTYEIYWNITPEKFVERMKKEYDKFWNNERKQKAKKLNLTQKEVTVLASIVQAEQSAHPEERPAIAGLYINRLKRGMLLQSDPTLIFASGDFSKKRVLNKDKETDSPYNTYMYAGLPPGPINMPDKSSIDAVLNYKHHNYIFMCAKEDFSGYHNFSANARQHEIYARRYRQALNKRKIWK